MKIIIKTLSNKKHQIDVEESDTILALKTRIDQELSLGDPELQKLIYGGKVLKNEQTIAEAKVKENGFIVVMIAKKKPPASVASSVPVPSAAPTSAQAPATSAQAVAPPSVPSNPDTGMLPCFWNNCVFDRYKIFV
jgi:UV excision repair protein RAD23